MIANSKDDYNWLPAEKMEKVQRDREKQYLKDHGPIPVLKPDYTAVVIEAKASRLRPEVES